ncbi:hypothetical protein [Petrocella sp. FN5]|uniref:hypothetical protein n=1 Tax=Petrocella sp. FN5 TaxID=3032002 RepID=UPI0023DCA07A|nr:hypothetical protein [Petrocella sp. FN5]MDF1617954.1 hypothetical protein [Petrocella sp. FN5]
MKELKITYDKKLDKYHTLYHHHENMTAFRLDIYRKLSQREDLFIMIETHLGSINQPIPLDYVMSIEKSLNRFNLQHQIRPIQVRHGKSILGILSKGKPIEDFAIAFLLPKEQFNHAIFETFFCEYDLKISYGIKTDPTSLFEDYRKGYVKSFDDPNYFTHHLFDSRIFNKFLSTEVLTPKLN